MAPIGQVQRGRPPEVAVTAENEDPHRSSSSHHRGSGWEGRYGTSRAGPSPEGRPPVEPGRQVCTTLIRSALRAPTGAPRVVCQDGAVRRPGDRSGPPRSRLLRLFPRFAAGSAVAFGCSEVTFLLLFGLLGASAALSGGVAFLAGAVPNFLLQRYWTWKRSGRIAVRGELLPYLAVIAVNGLLATAITAGVDRLFATALQHHGARTALLGATFAACYVLLYVLKFVLLDRLVFGAEEARARREERSRHQVPTITRA
ncbi:MAG: hypothetical protein GEV09_22465 [Pseudonocardiaceae bacterium]|nr:hypothetical protein [Pseudonocardiaceae bacterium]